MTPSSFMFKVSVPNDPTMAIVVGELARHAADYAQLDAGAAAAFVERAQALAATALNNGRGTSCTAVFSAENGTLTVTIGGESASQSLSTP
jgi:hypothetical protein